MHSQLFSHCLVFSVEALAAAAPNSHPMEAQLAHSRALHHHADLYFTPATLPAAPAPTQHCDKVMLPLGALMLAASVGSWTQSVSTPATATLSTVPVKAIADVQSKDPPRGN